ncbi:PREDICTED: BAG family molecular chaperone regulator 2-like [Fragaria vesca subsp. vesca]|uniref:BAG family molecular chaperone regulator 2-like n=1 Tax=Fragaria vesca subsp. vesca TaxID=101020 RepID=UPI0002C31692|nr:PREDICTED: BAG family molecular chaperone regulator 2-like [Fragaria vesca subsp. vesca]
MMKLRSKRFCRSFSSSKIKQAGTTTEQKGHQFDNSKAIKVDGEIKWELRPGGMLVQRRETPNAGEGMITVKVSTVSQWHDISVEPTSTFGELKMILSLVTGMEAREQRLLYKGKEREDGEYLHMVGVRDKDKVLLLQDPAMKEMKQMLHGSNIATSTCSRTISV